MSDSLDIEDEESLTIEQQTSSTLIIPPSLSRCNYDTCVNQSYFGNSYHTYRTAIFILHISTSLLLPSRIKSMSLEILHSLSISIIQQAHNSVSNSSSSSSLSSISSTFTSSLTSLTPSRLSLSCPLWSYDETPVVSVSSICMACKVCCD